MKHLPLGISIAYLLFISIKSNFTATTTQEMVIVGLLFAFTAVNAFITHMKEIKSMELEKSNTLSEQHLNLERERFEVQKRSIDPEVEKLQRELQISELKARQFHLETEQNKKKKLGEVAQSVGITF